jgi:beta-glucosidase
MTDGPHGVRANQPDTGRVVSLATSFPTGVAMASSWNIELIERLGVALGEETRALGCDILLGPCVNIVRTPLAGRNFESYSEDPYLAGRIGVAYVRGVQSQNVGTSLKHYACNNQEDERSRGSSQVDERTLREIYLPHFEAVVKEANPWTVMCSYNRINGVYASQNYYLLTEILREEWGFQGAVISDWGANHTIFESLVGGLDLEMPGPAKYYGSLLMEALRNWQVQAETVDRAARRILRMVIQSGKMDGSTKRLVGSVNTPEHQSLAREVAEESITLLKNNNNLLPLNTSQWRSIAVIGPNAADYPVSGGGSSCLEPPYQVSVLKGIMDKLGNKLEVRYEQGCDNYIELPTLRADCLVPAHGTELGMWGEYFNNTAFHGEPVLQRLDRKLNFWWFSSGPTKEIGEQFSVRWSAALTAPTTGRYTFKLSNSGTARLYLDGKKLIESQTDITPGEFIPSEEAAQVDLSANEAYNLRVEFVKPAEAIFGHIQVMFAHTPPPEQDDRLARAVELAKRCDAAIVVVGMPESYETEGRDRQNLELPGRQNELIEAVCKANRNTVVILICGSPVTMPWIESVPALLHAYYPGLEGGNAIARVLVGEVNPSGKLTVTYPRRLEDTPAFTHMSYGGAREVIYGEGIFVGYRYYDARGIEPLFPFGYGLSYTAFEYSGLQAPKSIQPGETIQVSIHIKNTGKYDGKEVVQLYVHDIESSLVRPPKELKGFAKVSLHQGEERRIQFTLDERALSYYDPQRKGWVAESGEFEILVGSSSDDIRARAVLTLTGDE